MRYVHAAESLHAQSPPLSPSDGPRASGRFHFAAQGFGQIERSEDSSSVASFFRNVSCDRFTRRPVCSPIRSSKVPSWGGRAWRRRLRHRGDDRRPYGGFWLGCVERQMHAKDVDLSLAGQLRQRHENFPGGAEDAANQLADDGLAVLLVALRLRENKFTKHLKIEPEFSQCL